MDDAGLLVRRATVDDLTGLATLWARTGLQVLDLERHLTEFQLVSTWTGELEAALALRIQGQEGLLHSEAFVRPEQENEFRQLLWERVCNLARSHGLLRLWTQEQAPFWHQVAGFEVAQPEDLKRLPPAFGHTHQRWSVRTLRRDAPGGISLEREFELFQQASRASLSQVVDRTRRLRMAGYWLAAILFLGLFGLAVVLAIRGARQQRAPSRLRR